MRMGYGCGGWGLGRVGAAALVGLLGMGMARPIARGAEPMPASTPTADQLAFFESKVRPVLVEHCQSCHGEAKTKGGLRLDSLAAILAGGDSGPAVVPGEPAESLLVEVVGYASDLKMPPKGKLPAPAIAAVEAWVKMGAPWPDSAGTPAVAPAPEGGKGPLFTPEQKGFWAFRTPVEPKLPEVADPAWAGSPIDRFIRAGLDAKGLRPAPPAEKRTLIRRVTYDLTGLPPTPEEVAAFLADESPGAFATVVDRLLASPRYGERWARHWLDVARYADSNGMDENVAMANAWRYRDYVIDAFNRDKPYDQFVREQLAGDLIAGSSESADDPTAALIATGFLNIGPKMLAEDDPVKMEMDIIDEQVDTVGKAFLGLTLGCARCHDHKFDPVPTLDYYSLAGIFKSTKSMANHKVVAMWHERPLDPGQKLTEDLTARTQARKTAINQATRDARRKLVEESRTRAADYLVAAGTLHRRAAALKALAGPPLADSAPAGTLVVEAEDFREGNVAKDHDGYGKGIGIILNAGPTPNVAQYAIEVPAAGAYQLELRYAAAESRPVRLSLNGRPVRADAAAAVTGSWNPDGQRWAVEAIEPLSAGTLTVRLERDGPFPHIDKLALVPRTLPAGVDLAALPSAEEVAGRSKLNPALLGRWTDALARAAADPKSALHAWHAWEAGGPPATSTSPWTAPQPSPAADLVLAGPRPWTARDLAGRYAAAIARAAESKEVKDPALVPFRALLDDPEGPLGLRGQAAEAAFPAETVATLKALRDELAALEQEEAKIPRAMAVEDQAVVDLKVHIRGSHLTLGEPAPRRFLRVIAGEDQAPVGPDRSGRLELADWLTRPDHPLTARVMVNRIWQHHFGAALVRSPDNFGKLGERPTHPELLDWLAIRFVESGWSIKAMHRLILNTAAYRMGTAYHEAAAEADPDNRLLWRMNRRRLEAEAVRDALFAVGAGLDLTMGGSLLPTKNHAYVSDTGSDRNKGLFASDRRSVYLPVIRSGVYPVFQAFDFADPSTAMGQRDVTTVAPQALFMLNDELVARNSKALADRLLAAADLDDAGRVARAYELAFARPPAPPEVDRALAFAAAFDRALADRGQADPAARRARAWQGLCHALLASSEFLFLD